MKRVMKVVDVVEKEEETDYENLFKLFKTLDAQEKEIKKRKDKIKKQLDDYVDSHESADSKGNRFYRFVDDSGNETFYKREARKSYSIRDEKSAADFFSSKGLTDCYKVVQRVEFNDDAIEQCVISGEITMEDMKSLYEEKVTFASKVMKKKDTEEDAT